MVWNSAEHCVSVKQIHCQLDVSLPAGSPQLVLVLLLLTNNIMVDVHFAFAFSLLHVLSNW